MRKKVVWLGAFLVKILLAPLGAFAEDTLRLYYFERVPYIEVSRGEVMGLTATPVARALKAAGIDFDWREMPFKRQLATIKENKERACGVGWFKNAVREEFARFSISVYQDKPTIVIGRKDDLRISKAHSLVALLKNRELSLLVKDSFSYGKYIDRLLITEKPEKAVVVGSSNLEMLEMILGKRADYFFAAEEEAEIMIESSGFAKGQFTLHRFLNEPYGNHRYLACSMAVPVEIIDRFNKALQALAP